MEILDLDRALDGLAAEDEDLARLIEMRYFGGMLRRKLDSPTAS